MSSIIKVLKGKVEDIELPEKVDVIVSEPIGFLLVSYGSRSPPPPHPGAYPLYHVSQANVGSLETSEVKSFSDCCL